MSTSETPQEKASVRRIETLWTLRQMSWPLVFVASMGWLVWQMPAILMSLGLASESLARSASTATSLDWLMALVFIASFVAGVRNVETTSMELPEKTLFDRISLFLGRVCMIMIAATVGVMFFEVLMRYLFSSPTLWANEMSLWMAGFLFAVSGVYTMQQRGHIAISVLYDAVPGWVQRIFDGISTLLIVAFAVVMVWGAWNEARDKFLRWETFGTAFDPPIPATLKPLILIVISLIALQALVNFILDCRAAARRGNNGQPGKKDLLHNTLKTAAPSKPLIRKKDR